MKYVSSSVISWLWPEVVHSWRRDVLWIWRRRLRQLKMCRVSRKKAFWWRFGERHDKAANLQEVEGPDRKTFSTKWRSLIFLVGFFLSEVRSGDEKGIDFDQRGFLQLWCFHSSSLEVAKKYIIAESNLHSGREKQVDYSVASSQKKFDLTAAGKSRLIILSTFKKRSWFFTAARKNKWIFDVIFELDRHSQRQRKTFFMGFFFQMTRELKLLVVVSDQAFSILPMIFLSCPSWRRYCRGLRRLPESLLPPWDGLVERYYDQILTIGEGKMLERRLRFFSSGRDVAVALLHSRVSWVSYPDGVK